jgi:PAS domain S-box-containing protein
MDATTFSPQLPLVYDRETVLAASEPAVERMRAALDAGSVGVFDIDLLTGVSHFCPRARRLWGISADEPVTIDRLRAAVLPDDRRELVTLLAANGHGTHEIEIVFRIVRPDRSERWIQARGRVTIGRRGGHLQPVRGLGAMFDVTARVDSETQQRRLIEEQQRVSAERFDLATRAAAVGLYDFDILHDSVDWSATLREIWGVGPDEPLNYATFAAGLHPEDRERVEAAVQQACDPDGDGRVTIEYRVVRRSDRQVRWVSGTGRVMFDEQRRAVRLIGTVQDITERKCMSLALERTEELTRRVTDAVPGILYVYDLDERRNVWGNREVTEMLGYTSAEIAQMSGRLLEALLHPEDFKAYADHERRLRSLRDDEIVDFEYRMRCANGKWLWLHSREMCFRRGADGRPNQIVGAALNISDRKEYEERLAESERRLSAVLNNTTSSIFLMDDRQQCIYMNASAEKLTGYNVAETQGRPLHDVVHHTHPDGTPYPLTDCPIDQAFPKRNQMQGEEVFVHKDGSFYPVAFTASPVMGDEGEPVGTVIEVRDIRAEKAAAEALRASREQLQVALDSADLASWELDLRTGVVDRTLRHDRIFGYDSLLPDWNLETCERHMLPEDRPVFRAAMEKALETGRIDFQVRVRWPDGSVHWIAPKGRTHYDERGRPVRMSGVLADVTRARQVEEALREADRNKDRFLAILSHELRNPLAPIRTAAHVLSQPHVSDAQLLTARQIIQRQVTHMSGLLDDLLDLARITQGKLELKCTRITLNEVVDSAVEAARPLLDHKRHTLDLQLPETPVRFEGDPLRLAQVLSNLLNNAAKYTDPGGHVALVARVIEDKGELRISVTDNGIGIDVEVRDKLFTMFGQAVGAATRAEGGLGIGLALVKGIVQLHGGSIEVHSEGPGTGSTFSVCLPLRPPAGRDAAPDAEQSPETKTCAGRRVLIADDNHDAADALAMLLGALGHDVRVVYGGQSALTLAAKFRPDVALLDIGMPDLDGYEVARRLRAEPWGGGIYLAAITGWGQDEDLDRARRAGFNRHFTKPVDPDEVAELLQQQGES